MFFNSVDYALFLLAAFSVYWTLNRRQLQNGVLLIAGYFFYGFVHPWFCILIAIVTAVNFFAALAMERFASQRKSWLIAALVVTLGNLGLFKYFDFFAANFQTIALAAGLPFSSPALDILLPVGISFYSFQTLGYTVDVYRKQVNPRRNFVDFALFVSFFPLLMAGPIERASHLLPQIEQARRWQWDRLFSAWPLLVSGYLKKVVIADSLAPYVNKVFALQSPTLFLLIAGSLAFTVQIYADFSAYTDIARGSARLFGFELVENFKSPYAAISPSDFWRRWHISLSTWIRDYLYLPLGGSRQDRWWKQLLALLVALGLSGLWHGAAWHFIAWGLYHGMILYLYRVAGFGGKWVPRTASGKWTAWAVMLILSVVGWTIFRAPSLTWLGHVFVGDAAGFGEAAAAAGLVILVWTGIYVLSITLLKYLNDDRYAEKRILRAALAGVAIVLITIFAPGAQQDFIYFQF